MVFFIGVYKQRTAWELKERLDNFLLSGCPGHARNIEHSVDHLSRLPVSDEITTHKQPWILSKDTS
jgi:hypothetical protein